jgi:dimethylglycine dehydrogenase
MSIVRKGDDDFTLITAASAQWHDFEVLKKALADGLSLVDRTLEVNTFIVTGPKSRDLISGMTDADLSLGWLTHQDATVAGKAVRLLRVSFAGEMGWEVHAPIADAAEIYDAIIGAGAKPFGMYALDSLRLEKGYRTWKGDLSTDYSLFEGGLDRFVKLDKPQDFRGKAALQNEKQQGTAKRFSILKVDVGAADAPYMSTCWSGGDVVGETTSGGWGYRVGHSIAHAMLRADLATPGTEIEVEIYGERRKAVVQEDQPLWDPANERLRA